MSSQRNRDRLGTIKENINESNPNSYNTSELEKKYFEDDNNFIDYFVEIGVSPEIFKNHFLYNSESLNDINVNILPQIITKFPKIDKKYIVIENTIVQQIFPHGFNAVEAEAKPDSEFYSIILDNQLYSATYTHKYLACLLVYESIKDYEILNEKYKSIDFLCQYMNGKPRETLDNFDKDKDKEKRYKNYYIPKCLIIVSVFPCFNKFEEILRSLYDLVMSNKHKELYIDRIIEKMIVETPKLPRGFKRIKLKLPNKIIDLTERKMNDYPSININLSKLFGTLKMSNIIEIFRYLLFETKMIFFSAKLYDLTNTIMSILSLITPFKYQFQVVSVLPTELYNFIETISPFIFGINEAYDENFMKKNRITLEDSTICIVDIDQDKYYLLTTNDKKKEEFPDFPKHLKEKIEKDYNNYIQELIHKARNVNMKRREDVKSLDKIDDDVKEDNQIYQYIFFNFMIFLLKDYPKFLSKDYGVGKDISMQVKNMIDINAYLNSVNSNERDFYKKIFNTQMFIEFIFTRMMPKDCNEKVEILFFEEKISEKMMSKKLFGKSKVKEQNILLSSKEYDYDKEEIIIDCSKDFGITDGVYEYLTSNKEQAKIEFINKGYVVDVDEGNNKVYFKYHIFPRLFSDQFFSLNNQLYTIPIQYYKTVDLINSNIVNKSHLKFNNKELKNSEAGNDLYLCYLIIWALTLWYTDNWEREFRFLKMIEVIEKIEVHEIEIFELLFKEIVNYCNDKDTVLLYKKFIHLNLNPTWNIFSLVSRIIKKKTNIKNKKELLSQQTKFKDLKNPRKSKNVNEVIDFRSRTLKTKDVDDKILSEDVIFYAYGHCKTCNEYINLMTLCSNVSQLKTKTENGKDYFKCPHKHHKSNNSQNNEYVRLKMRLNFGVELFNLKLKGNRQSTSCHDRMDLLSPTTLKHKLLNISRELGKEKFNVEQFKNNHKELFWNLIWFLELNDMDVSFMLPYSYESCNMINDNHSEILKKVISNKYKMDQDVDIENIIKSPDTKSAIIFFGKKDALGGKTGEEELKKNVFTFPKNKYTSDLVIQYAFSFQINNKIGMISYTKLDSFSENIGFNELPDKFDSVTKDTEAVFLGLRTFTSTAFDLNASLKSRGSCFITPVPSMLPNIHPNVPAKPIQPKVIPPKITPPPIDNSIKKNKTDIVSTMPNEMPSSIDELINNHPLSFKKKRRGAVRGHKKVKIDPGFDNDMDNNLVEPVKKNEELDFYSQFDENQKKMDNENWGGLENDEDIMPIRKSTLKNGILFDEKIENNIIYDDDEEEEKEGEEKDKEKERETTEQETVKEKEPETEKESGE